MSDVQVKFKRGNTSTLNSTAVTDGLIYFNTQNKRIYLDNGDERLEYKNVTTNYMTKATLETLINKTDMEEFCPSYDKVNNIIGNSYIGEDSIIDTIDGLLEDKALFELAWEDIKPYRKSLNSMTITLPKTYAFLIMFYHNYNSGTGSFQYDDYRIFVNNTTFYIEPNWQDGNSNSKTQQYISTDQNAVASYISGARLISISGTQVNIGRYGSYDRGAITQTYSNVNAIPYKIIGVLNTQ